MKLGVTQVIFAGVIILISPSQFLDIFSPSNKFENERGWDHLQGVSISRLHCIQTSICLFWHCSCSKEYIHIEMIVQDTYRYRSKCVCKYPGQVIGSCAGIFWPCFFPFYTFFVVLLFWYCFFSKLMGWSCTVGQVLGSWPLHRWHILEFASIFCCPSLCLLSHFVRLVDRYYLEVSTISGLVDRY